MMRLSTFQNLKFGLRNAIVHGAVLLAAAAIGQGAVINFSELPTQAVDGVSLQGVTFGFTYDGLSSTDAIFNYTEDLGALLYVSLPVLEGNTEGVLTLSFANPTSLLQFAVVLSTSMAQTSGIQVLLSGPGFVTPTSFSLDLTQPSGSDFVEGQFVSSGALINQAVISFNSDDAGRFALDDLAYNGEEASVPEPGSLALFGSGLLAVVVGGRRLKARAGRTA